MRKLNLKEKVRAYFGCFGFGVVINHFLHHSVSDFFRNYGSRSKVFSPIARSASSHLKQHG